MEQTKQPSPYFIRRTPRAEGQTVDIRDYSVVEDQVHPLRDYWLIAKRHRWLILSCALVFFIGAALYTFTRTPLYTSEATLLIERKAPQILKLQDARGDTADYNDYNNEFYKTQYEILKSPALAERVVRDEGLENHPVFGGGKITEAAKEGLVSGIWKELKNSAKGVMPAKQKPVPAESIPLSTRLAGYYLSMLEVRPVAGTSLVVIKITTPDPALAARLANAHASSYVRYGIDLRSQTNNEAGEFLQQKLTELKERIEQSEAALNSYRKEKGIISVDDKSNVIIERLLDLNKGLTAAEGERIAWEAQVRAARGRNAEEIPSVRISSVINILKAELAKFEAEYASLAKEFKPGYPPLDNVRARIEETRRRLTGEIDREVKSIEAGYAAATNKESQLRSVMDEQKKATLNLKDSAVQYAILAREVDTNKQLYDGVLSRLKEIGVAAEVRSSNIHVMGNALPPGAPSYPDKRRTMMLGLVLGLVGGIGLAFLLEQLDNTLKTPEEAERYLRLASLGMVPDFAAVNGRSNGFVSRLLQSAQAELPVASRKAGSKGSPSEVLLDHGPLSVVGEAYRSFRSALLLSQAGGPPHTILVTSAGRSDGKTTTLVNTAIVFAQLGIRVLIIDADLRRPRCHMLLRMENAVGLSEILAGQIDLQNGIRPTPAENLFLISAGALPPNPAELLGSEKMHHFLQQLREQFEFIFIDSCPILAVSDSVFLSTMVDGTLLVVSSKTPKPLVKKARARLTIPQTKVLGMLLNRVDIHNSEYGGYYQQYYTYYRDDDPAISDSATGISENGHGRSPRKNPLNGKTAPMAEPPASKKPGNGLSTEVSDVAKFSQVTGPTTVESIPDAKSEEQARRVSEEILHDDRKRSDEHSAKESQKPREHTEGGGWETPAGNGNSIAKHVARSESPETQEFLKTMAVNLKAAIGPMAPVVLSDHIRALGESSRAFPDAKLGELTRRISKEITNDFNRRRFATAMLEEMKNVATHATSEPDRRRSEASAVSGNRIDGKRSHIAASEKPVIVLTAEMMHASRLSSGFLNVVRVKLGEVMGPMARRVLSDHIRALGESFDSFPEAKLEELTRRVSKEILDDCHRQRFEKELSEEIQKLGLQANGRLSDEQTKRNGTTKSAAKKEVGDKQEFPRIMSAMLAEAIGPTAPSVLRERIVALGESAEAFPRARIEELIVQVSVEISDEPTRRQFQKEMAREIQKLKQQGAWG